jgi:hypothetical protein
VNTDINPSEVLFEFKRMGGYVKVTALHPASLVEVSITGDAKASPQYLQQLALARLRQQIEKKKS